jgi:Alpha-2,8-polysialyltransferase (POLYST)
MRNAFVCCTPYHVIVSVHMARNLYTNDRNEIFISNHFGDSIKIYKNLKKSDLFHNVYYVTDKELSYDKSFLKISKIKGFLFNEKKSILSEEIDFNYDKLFLFTHSFFSILITNLVKKNNKNAQISMVEEGIMTYLLGTNNLKDKIKNYIDIICKFFLNKRFLNPKMVNYIYLFEPKLYSGNFNYKLRKIPKIPLDSNFCSKLNEIFNYSAQSNFKTAKFIFFDQSFGIDKNKQIDERKVIEELLNFLINDEVLIKLHPRDSKDKYQDLNLKNVNNSNYPWEIICYNEEIKNRVLIAVNSSAVFTPQILFRKMNSIILLHKVFGVNNTQFNNFLEKFVSNFKGSNIYIPKDFIELREIINLLKNR